MVRKFYKQFGPYELMLKNRASVGGGFARNEGVRLLVVGFGIC